MRVQSWSYHAYEFETMVELETDFGVADSTFNAEFHINKDGALFYNHSTGML